MQSETADFVLGAATWRAERNIRVVFDLGLFLNYVEVTSSTKPEVHNINISHCRQRRIEPRPRVTSIENLVKVGPVIFEIGLGLSKWTDKQTYRQTS